MDGLGAVGWAVNGGGNAVNVGRTVHGSLAATGDDWCSFGMVQ